jgi:hypothetical protein
MMDKFKIGDKVIKYRGEVSEGKAPIGTIGTITECKNSRKRPSGEYESAYITDTLTPSGYPWAPLEEDIKLLYDGDEKTSWEECEWKPNPHRVQIKIGEVAEEGKGYTGESFHTQ